MTEKEREAALGELVQLQEQLARKRLLAFTSFCNAEYEPSWHHAVVAQELDGVLAGRTKRLMLFMPPQHGKTELASRNLVPLALGQNPDLQVIFGTYNADRAKEVSADVQAIMESAQYRRLFPGTKLAGTKDDEVKNALKFDVVGRKGGYQAAGVGQGITGKSMMLGVIDDPVRGREDAESEAIRKKTKDWYRADFSTRQAGDQCAIVVIMTRWHTDDLAGWLLDLSRQHPSLPPWRVVAFQALLEKRMWPDDPRPPGAALWPSRFSEAWLRAERVVKGSYDWSALYQQEPIPPGGAMAQRAWFKVGRPQSPVVRRCRCWDLAGTEQVGTNDPDWTVGTRLAWHSDNSVTVEHVVRTRATAAAVDQLMHQTAVADGRDCLIAEWQDPGAAGKAVIAAHLRLLAGWDYEALPSSGEKSLRWRPFLVQAEGGNVWVEQGEWTAVWLDEMSTVPYASHDDQADSVAGAYQRLASHKPKGPTVGAVLPGSQTASGPTRGEWRRQYFSGR